MNGFEIGQIYKENGKRLVQIRPLPAKYCSFDCVFCPLEKNESKIDNTVVFTETKEFLLRLANFLDENQVDMVFITPNGEALVNAELGEVIKIIKDRGSAVRLLSNGYMLGYKEFGGLLESCDEIIGELAVVNDADFKKLLRPIEGFSLEKYVENMATFNKWYSGTFILDITILKNYSDSEEALDGFEQMIKKINPSYVYFQTSDHEKLKGAFEVSDERLLEIQNRFKAIVGVLGQ